MRNHISDIWNISSNQSLKTHTRVHIKEKPYQCEYCQKCFTRSFNLNTIRIHTKEKLFKCEYCQKCFTLRSNFLQHTRIHTIKKPYQCDICQKCFSSNQNKKSHTRVHIKEKDYYVPVWVLPKTFFLKLKSQKTQQNSQKRNTF